MIQLPLRCLVLLILHGQASSSGFVWTSRRAYGDASWGTFCYNLEDHKPTCGWKVVLKSSSPLTRMEVWDSYYVTTDNFVFTLTNLSFSGDFRRISKCANINIFGPFGNALPDVVITWLCVCDGTTGGVCKNVISPSDVSSITNGPASLLLGYYNPVTKSLSASDYCYKGGHSVVLVGSTHLVDCATTCGSLSKCTGVNYRTDSMQCELVYEITDSNPNLMGAEDGCLFWTVLSP